MKNILLRVFLRGVLCFGLLFAVNLISPCQPARIVKITELYDSIKAYRIDNPEAVLATAIVETGWLECTDCSRNMNNLFGFRLDEGYIEFSNYSECLAYMKKWQQAFYTPWRAKHPGANYYDFLTWVNYAQSMPDYINLLKSLEQWVILNVEINRMDALQMFLPLRFPNDDGLWVAKL